MSRERWLPPLAALIAVLAIIIGAAPTAVDGAAASFPSDANLSGNYSFSLYGHDFSLPGPNNAFAAAGELQLDGKGLITGSSASVNDGGVVCHGSVSGSYRVTSDGQGELNFSVFPTPALPCAHWELKFGMSDFATISGQLIATTLQYENSVAPTLEVAGIARHWGFLQPICSPICPDGSP